MHGSLKHNAMFSKRIPLEKLESGFGPSCFFLMGALHNRRFLNDKRVMDSNIKAFFPILHEIFEMIIPMKKIKSHIYQI